MDQITVRQHFDYEASTGLLRKKWGAPYPWRKTGYRGRYRACTLGGRTHYLHRLVFLWHHGVLPAAIDHLDGDFENNRIENLRPCTNAQNQYNSPRKANNRSGFKGVVFHAKCRSRPWQAKIVENGKVKSLGYFATPEEAGDAYDRGAVSVAGVFARPNSGAGA